jgi:hypothetical protein
MLSIGFFPLSRSLTTVNYLPYSRVVFRRNNRSWVPGACQGRQRRAQPDEGVLFLTTFAARTMLYSISKALKKQTSSGFACAMNNSHARHAKRCVVGNWIPAPLNSNRIRSRRFVNGRSLIKFDLLVARFDSRDGSFNLVSIKPERSGRKRQPFSHHKFWHTTCIYRVKNRQPQ